MQRSVAPTPFTPLQKLGVVSFVGLLLLGGWFFISGRAATSLGLTLTSNPDLERGLIAHYTFDGDNLDLSSNTAEVRNRVSASYYGNWLAHASTTVQGPLGQAIDFDGTNDSVSIGNTAQTVRTVSFWVKADATTEQPYVALNGTTAKIELKSSNVEFGTGGVVTSTPGNEVYALTSDGTYLYLAGSDYNIDWRIEKRAMSDGATTTTTGFGTNGAVTYPGSVPYAIIHDGTYLYVGGVDTSTNDWRIEKRAMSDGATTTTTGFGTNGSLKSTPGEVILGMVHDGTYLYAAGSGGDGPYNCRIEKRTMSDGATTTTTGFGTNGAVVSPFNVCGGLNDIVDDGTYLYTANVSGAGSWRIEKRAMSDGATTTTTGFGTNGGLTTTAAVESMQLIHDGTYLYGVGYTGLVNQDWYIEKRTMSDGATTTTTGFGTNGSVKSSPGSNAFDVVDDGTYLYVIGHTTLAGGDWRIEKRAMSDGATTTTTGFGTNGAVTSAAGSIPYALIEDGTYLYIVGEDESSNWRIEKRRMSDGSLADGTGGSTPVVTATGFTAPTVYVDGVQTTTLPDSGWHHVTITDTTGALASNTILGSDGTSYLNGSLDDVRLYNRALSAAEVKRMYELGATTRVGVTLTTNDSLEEGLVTHYTFDSKDYDWTAARQLLDRTGLGSDCALDPSAEHGTTTVPGVIGQAYRFSSSTVTDDDDMFMCTETPLTALAFGATTDFTIAFWFNGITNDSTWITVQNFGWGSAEGGWRITVDSSGKLRVNLDDGTTDLLSSTDGVSMRSNEWYHILITFDRDGNMTRYINGVQSGTADSIAAVGDVTQNAASWMPLNTGSTGNPGDFTMDDFRIYNRLLTQEEITRLYGLGNTTWVGATVDTNPDLVRGLVAHYTFDAADLNLSSNTAEIENRVSASYFGNWLAHGTTTRPGMVGQALWFDGVNDVVSVADNAALDAQTDMTVAAWVYLDKLATEQKFLYKDNVASPFESWELYMNASNQIIFQVANTVAGYFSAGYTGTVRAETWYHLVGVKQGTDLSFYLNGSTAGTYTDTYSGTLVNGDSPLYIGAGYGGTANPLQGRLDDVRIYSRALSAGEVKRLYELGG